MRPVTVAVREQHPDASPCDPLLFGTPDLGYPLEVSVVMDQRQTAFSSRRRDHEVANQYPVLAAPRQGVLQVNRCCHGFRGDRGAVETSPFFEYSLVLAHSTAGAENLQIDDGADGYEAISEEWAKTLGDLGMREAGESTLVRQLPSVQRRAPDITLGLSRSSPAMLSSRSA